MGKKTSLEDALENVVNSLDKIVEKTARDIGKKVTKDLNKKSKEAVKHYYDSYRPEVYDRTYALYHSYKVWDKTAGNEVMVSVEFSPNLIENAHKSSSQYHQTGDTWNKIEWPWENPVGNDYGAPEADWIMWNFIHGIHPITYGNKYVGFTYSPKVDSKSPYGLLLDFVNGDYIQKELVPYANDMFTNRVIETLRKQF